MCGVNGLLDHACRKRDGKCGMFAFFPTLGFAYEKEYNTGIVLINTALAI